MMRLLRFRRSRLCRCRPLTLSGQIPPCGEAADSSPIWPRRARAMEALGPETVFVA
jgi:hypothetical protein